jgi:hypothetical protein
MTHTHSKTWKCDPYCAPEVRHPPLSSRQKGKYIMNEIGDSGPIQVFTEVG